MYDRLNIVPLFRTLYELNCKVSLNRGNKTVDAMLGCWFINSHSRYTSESVERRPVSEESNASGAIAGYS
jgi:hypothetical protein